MSGEDGGDQGGTGGTGGADGGGDHGAGAQGAGGGDAPALYRPDGLADSFFGDTDQGTIDNLAKAVNDRRAADEKLGKVPDKPDGYTLPEKLPDGFSPQVAQLLAQLPGDPVYAAIQKVFHKVQMREPVFQEVVPAIFQELVEGELMEEMIDPVAERKLMVPDALQNASAKEQGEAVDTLLNDNRGWLQSLGGDGDKALDADAVKALENGLLDTAAGNRAIAGLRSLIPASTNPVTGGQGGGGGVTKEHLKKRAADPRNKTDPAFSAETDRLYQEFHGD